MSSSLFEPWHLSLLDELRVARLGTIAPTGLPHLVPVCYAIVEERIIIAVDEKPKSSRNLARLRNIHGDPRVSVLFDRYDDDWARLAWVRVDGLASVAEAGHADSPALGSLRARYLQYGGMDLESAPLISITATKVTGWRWSE